MLLPFGKEDSYDSNDIANGFSPQRLAAGDTGTQQLDPNRTGWRPE
jgi:hypothetical protein